MPYTKVSIPKQFGGPGAPVPKDPNVIFIRLRDIEKTGASWTGFPGRDGVVSTSDIQLKDGETAVGVYMTPLSINRHDDSEGDPDMAGFNSIFEGTHPGDEAAFAEWLQENLNEDLLILSMECSDSTGARLQGTPCNPMKLSVVGQDNNEGKNTVITANSVMRAKWKMMHYRGAIPPLAPDAGDEGSAGGGV